MRSIVDFPWLFRVKSAPGVFIKPSEAEINMREKWKRSMVYTTKMGGDLKRKKIESEPEAEKEKEIQTLEAGKSASELRDEILREAAEIVADFPSSRIAIVIAPPSYRSDEISVHTFGYPTSAEAVTQRFLDENSGLPVTEEEKEEAEKEKEKEKEKEEEPSRRRYWWDDVPFHLMNREQLDASIEYFQRLQDQLRFRLDAQLRIEALENLVNHKPGPKP